MSDYDNWTTIRTTNPSIVIPTTAQGEYEVSISSVNGLGYASTPNSFTFKTESQNLTVEDVTGLNSEIINNNSISLSWTQASSPLILNGGKVLIRHQPVVSNATWEDATEVVSPLSGSTTATSASLLNGTYLFKFENSNGIRSANASTLVVQALENETYQIASVLEHDDVPPFQGNRINMLYSSDNQGLIVAGGTNIDDIAIGQDWDGFSTFDGYDLVDDISDLIDTLGLIDGYPEIDLVADEGGWDAIPSVDEGEGGAASGEYFFLSPIALVGVFDVAFKRVLSIKSLLASSYVDLRADNLDVWTDFDGLVSDQATARLWGRASDDNATWTQWTTIANTILRGRYFEFKVEAETPSITQSLIVKELGVTGTVEQRTEVGTRTSNGTVTFQKAFYDTPGILLTALNQQTGDYPEITSANRSSMVVTWKDGSGNPVTRTFTYLVTGYGAEIV